MTNTDNMTTGANALLAWFRQPLAKIRTTTDRMTDASPRQYRTHVRRMCYQCRQEGHYARECPRAIALKPTETRMEKMQSLLQSMTPSERAQFKQEISPQMTAMRAHLRTMTTSERMEFKRQITPNATQILVKALKEKATHTDSLSRETSPHANQTSTGTLLSRETGPHPNKSIKKLAQALKKRAKYETEQKTRVPPFDHSRKTLANALKQNIKRRAERSTRTYAERIRELIGSPEQCKECGGEHPTRLCMKRFEKLRNPEMTPLPVTDDDLTNSDTLCDSEESEDNEGEPMTDLTKSLKKLSLTPTKSVTFDLPTDDPDILPNDTDDSMSNQSDDTEEPTS